MKQIVTTGIILSRTDYGEADRILTVLTPDHGKLRLKARGVRKVKSKLAGGIELFSTSNITFIEGRGGTGLATLISTRLIKHYGRIVQDIDRVQLGYELIKLLNKATEDHPEAEYYELLEQAFKALDDKAISPDLIRVWFHAQLLRQAGHTPNLRTDSSDVKLTAAELYNFDPENMVFTRHKRARYSANHIKALRLLFNGHSLQSIIKIEDIEATLNELSPTVSIMLTTHIKT